MRDVGAAIVAGVVRVLPIVVLLIVLSLLVVKRRLLADIKCLAALERALLMNGGLLFVIACFGFFENAK